MAIALFRHRQRYLLKAHSNHSSHSMRLVKSRSEMTEWPELAPGKICFSIGGPFGNGRLDFGLGFGQEDQKGNGFRFNRITFEEKNWCDFGSDRLSFFFNARLI